MHPEKHPAFSVKSVKSVAYGNYAEQLPWHKELPTQASPLRPSSCFFVPLATSWLSFSNSFR